jgi:hypothetical protein
MSESKQKKKLKSWYNFLHGQQAIWEKKKEKKGKLAPNQTQLQYMCHLEKKKGCQDESNDERNHDSNHRS